MRNRKGLQNIIVSNGLYFFERCSLMTAYKLNNVHCEIQWNGTILLKNPRSHVTYIHKTRIKVWSCSPSRTMMMFTSNETITKYNKANQTIPQLSFNIDHIETHLSTAAATQSGVAFALDAEGWVFESQLRQTLVVKTGNYSSTAKRSATGVSVTGPVS